MAIVTAETVLHVAKLARLKLTDLEVEQFTTELTKILGMVDQLNDADVSAVDGLSDHDAPLVTRPDTIVNSSARDIILTHAPSTESTYFQVPKILEG